LNRKGSVFAAVIKEAPASIGVPALLYKKTLPRPANFF
jgi:hypothetical protein